MTPIRPSAPGDHLTQSAPRARAPQVRRQPRPHAPRGLAAHLGLSPALIGAGLSCAALLGGCIEDSPQRQPTAEADAASGTLDGGAGSDARADGGAPPADARIPRADGDPPPGDGGPDATGDDRGVDPDAAPEPDSGPRLAPPGGACVADADCAAGTCLAAEAGFPDGYCAVTDCGPGTCADGTTCVETAAGAICAVDCGPEDCRAGYACEDAAPSAVCVPGDAGPGRVDGLPCADDAQCGGGACITDWPGGFCTTVGCETRVDCARGADAEIDNRCYVANDPPFCVRICQGANDCRQGFVCQPIGQGEGFCVPDPNEPLLDPEAVADSPLGIVCEEGPGGAWALPYTVAADTRAYMVVPFSADGAGLSPRTIALPDGNSINLRGENAFQTAPAQLFGGQNPTVVPATAEFERQRQAGDHTYNLNSDTREMCWYLLEESSPGTTIDLNVYLVDIGVTAAAAPRDNDLQATLDQFEAVYAGAGVRLGTVRYFDVGGEDAARFRIIRSEADIGELLTRTTAPGPTRDDVLSLNVVFIRGFALPGGGGILGISPGLPGPAGLHGTRNSGVVFTAEFLGERFRERSGAVVDGNLYTGNVLAHEVGHYLGLFHTTEQDGRSTDPLPDTPNCRNASFPTGCPDLTNLMFPFAGADNSQLSPGQTVVLQNNPLTKD